MIERICRECGEAFMVYPSRLLKPRGGDFCGKTCSGAAFRRERDPRNDPSRFWQRVRKSAESSGCWEWAGKRLKKNGYGRVSADGKVVLAHRLSWELANGPVPDSLCVLHHCDNPPCVKTEPDEKYPQGHLFLGTYLDNARDRDAKGRRVPLRGERCGPSKVKDADVPVIREMRRAGATYRAIGDRFGIKTSQVFRICDGQSRVELVDGRVAPKEAT